MYYAGEDSLTNTDRKHIQRALAVASTSTCNQRHGAVVAHGPRVLAVSVNRNRNSPLICTDPKAEAAFHAEIVALKQLSGIKWSDVTLYSARIGKAGDARMAKPCPKCQAVIDFLGIGKVVHT